MYVELVRRVIEEAVVEYTTRSEQPIDEVLEKIKDYIEATSREHRKDEPEIAYDDPLCRLGYLYMHVVANATLFEKVLIESEEIRERIKDASNDVMNIVSLGGGPGTELLGLAKYLLRRTVAQPPRKIVFTLVDNVPAWADTWVQLVDAVEDEFRSTMSDVEPPTIGEHFLPVDALALSAYENFPFNFKKADLVVMNYLFSENKTRLEQAGEAIQHLSRIVPSDCKFVVIDRIENNPKFKNDVVGLFEGIFGKEIEIHEQGGTLDGDEQTREMGQMLIETLKRTPRVKFFTDIYRDPTVFWFEVSRKE